MICSWELRVYLFLLASVITEGYDKRTHTHTHEYCNVSKQNCNDFFVRFALFSFFPFKTKIQG